MDSGPRSDRALVSCGRDTPIPPSTSAFPSGPVRTAILPPEPSSTLTLPRNLYTVTGEDAALFLIRVTSPRASAKAWWGLSQLPVAAKPHLSCSKDKNCGARADDSVAGPWGPHC